MSEHSIEELVRQYERASSRLRQAEIEESLAAKRLHDALVRKSGLLGKVAIGSKSSLLIQDVQFGRGRSGPAVSVTGLKINKDGKVDFAEGRVWLNDDTKITEYEAGATS